MLLSGLALTADATGDGFTRGLNRLMGFLLWQCAATALAILLFVLSRRLGIGGLRRAARLPAALAVLFWVLLVGSIAVAVWSNRPSDSQPNPAPTTQPSSDARPIAD
ncbi:MAG: hypothetical protein AAGF88_00245 [Pseudomonadota bacterium]